MILTLGLIETLIPYLWIVEVILYIFLEPHKAVLVLLSRFVC